MCFLWFIIPFLAQSQSVGYDKLTLKFTPSSLMSLSSPAWQFGLEYRPKKSFGINTEIGTNLSGLKYGFKCLSCSGEQYYHMNYKWRQEFRWYMTPGPNPEWYFAQEVFLMTDNYRLRNGLSKQDSISYRFGRGDYNRISFGTASKFGVLYNFSKNTRLEIFAGLGIRLHHSNVELFSEKKIGMISSSDTAFDRVRPNKTEIWPHISAGFKLGYVLWRENDETKINDFNNEK